MVQRALVVVETEQQRANHRAGAVLVPAKTGHHAIGRALVLHLDHRALAGAIGLVEPLGHHAVEPGSLEATEPVLGQRVIARGRRQVHGRGGACHHVLEALAALGERRLPQVFIAQREQVPRHERRRRLRGQQPDPRSGGMDAQQQRLEVEAAGADDDDLAVEDTPLGSSRRPFSVDAASSRPRRTG